MVAEFVHCNIPGSLQDQRLFPHRRGMCCGLPGQSFGSTSVVPGSVHHLFSTDLGVLLWTISALFMSTKYIRRRSWRAGCRITKLKYGHDHQIFLTLKNWNLELHSYSTTAAEHHKGKRCQVELKYKVFGGKYGRLYFEALESTMWERNVRPASVLRDDHQQKLRHWKIEI